MPRRLIMALCAAVAVAAVPASSAAAAPRPFTAHFVPFEGSRLYVRDYPGQGPALVLMHGFPDDLHLYDRLVPLLRGHRTVTFDFLGWGRSSKPRGHVYTFAEQERELDAVVRGLGLASIVPVVHDASGPGGINWALDNPSRTAALVLLNAFYSPMPTTNPPEAIRIFSDPAFADLARAILADRHMSRWLYDWQVGRFMSDPKVRASFLRKLWPAFVASRPAFASLNRDLIPAVTANAARTSELSAFRRPVRIIFGARDPYLNKGMARSFQDLMPESELFLLPARHYVQVDAASRVAELLRTMPTPEAPA